MFSINGLIRPASTLIKFYFIYINIILHLHFIELMEDFYKEKHWKICGYVHNYVSVILTDLSAVPGLDGADGADLLQLL